MHSALDPQAKLEQRSDDEVWRLKDAPPATLPLEKLLLGKLLLLEKEVLWEVCGKALKTLLLELPPLKMRLSRELDCKLQRVNGSPLYP